MARTTVGPGWRQEDWTKKDKPKKRPPTRRFTYRSGRRVSPAATGSSSPILNARADEGHLRGFGIRPIGVPSSETAFLPLVIAGAGIIAVGTALESGMMSTSFYRRRAGRRHDGGQRGGG